jgi:hypothetical protein
MYMWYHGDFALEISFRKYVGDWNTFVGPRPPVMWTVAGGWTQGPVSSRSIMSTVVVVRITSSWYSTSLTSVRAGFGPSLPLQVLVVRRAGDICNWKTVDAGRLPFRRWMIRMNCGRDGRHGTSTLQAISGTVQSITASAM